MKTYANKEIVDAVVIGTGAGGSPLLAKLSAAGMKVVALEAGPYWNPAVDFASDEREQNKLYWPHERLSAGADPIIFGRNNSGTGVGGSTLHYTAYMPRPHPEDFMLYTEAGVSADWPLTYYDLERYYDELEWFLGISGPTPYPWGPARKRGYPLAALPLNAPAQLMEKGCRTLGIRTSPAANAALSAAYYQEPIGWRHACTNRGFCEAGCNNGAKASMDVTFIPLAVHHGAEIRPACFVTELEEDRSGRITAVAYLQNGKQQKQLCKWIFLCAGAIETPRLLLYNKMANSSNQVGRNFMAHTSLQLWGEFEEETHPYKGIPGGLISEDTLRPHGADFASGYLVQSIGVLPVTYASTLVRTTGLWGAALRERMQQYNHVAGINMHGDCLPQPGNFLALSDEQDDMGLPKPVVYFSNGDNEKRMAAHAKALMTRIWEAAGARHIWSNMRNAHTIGTCRMGTDPALSVVNSEGRSHDIPNLYICDNSIFPSALRVNPSLTIMALSLRTADLFLAHSKRLENASL
ncbi:MAG: GMC family oxidoreductase [Williamsia sp.]|nr:GMC family oxidoreductase [Williamsia sp.]